MKLAAAAYPLDRYDSFASYEAKITRWVEAAAGAGADLLVFPEYAALELSALGGEAVASDLEESMLEVARHAGALEALHLDLAARNGVTILGGSAPVWVDGHDRPVNRAVLYGPAGVIGHQDKQIMTRFEREELDMRAGRQKLEVFDTPVGRVGITICYDVEFPLLGRQLIEDGATILLAPSATETLAGFHRVRIGAQARALEGQCFVLQASIIGDALWCEVIGSGTGRAAIYGPPDLGFPESGVLAETALNQPGWAIAEVSAAAIERVRAQGQVLNFAHWPEQTRILVPA